jgi:hypothetical protein
MPTVVMPDDEKFMHSQITVLSTMAGAGSNADGTPSDYERQYQEDLERAQALSLESLALEKFRLQKQQELKQFQLTSSSYNGRHNTSSANT